MWVIHYGEIHKMYLRKNLQKAPRGTLTWSHYTDNRRVYKTNASAGRAATSASRAMPGVKIYIREISQP